jgi:hypothetical protein
LGDEHRTAVGGRGQTAAFQDSPHRSRRLLRWLWSRFGLGVLLGLSFAGGLFRYRDDDAAGRPLFLAFLVLFGLGFAAGTAIAWVLKRMLPPARPQTPEQADLERRLKGLDAARRRRRRRG